MSLLDNNILHCDLKCITLIWEEIIETFKMELNSDLISEWRYVGVFWLLNKDKWLQISQELKMLNVNIPNWVFLEMVIKP